MSADARTITTTLRDGVRAHLAHLTQPFMYIHPYSHSRRTRTDNGAGECTFLHHWSTLSHMSVCWLLVGRSEHGSITATQHRYPPLSVRHVVAVWSHAIPPPSPPRCMRAVLRLCPSSDPPTVQTIYL
ncbi:unnamed protein product [Ceratitis capitata]|uniref:(Mediterranean fruit fly) hypothetical protein n=1 Tax=Ceratitis capitata TaxID=7213 RepID=A0A811ULA3_CERCA|nr:unnamed protein product [Ceratitis capitata]